MKTEYAFLKSLLLTAIITLVATPAFAQIIEDGSGDAAPGKIEVIDSYDWGETGPGELKAVIEIKNVGKGDLKISNVKPSCGCTTAPLDKDVLKPGETGKLDVTLNARHAGDLHKSIVIYSNDPENNTKIVKLHATVKQNVTFLPDVSYMMVNQGKVGVATPSSFRIKNTGDEAFTVYPPELLEGNVNVRFDLTSEKVVKPGEEMELTAYITPKEVGRPTGSIMIKTSDKELPSRTFTIYGNVMDDNQEANRTQSSHNTPQK